MSGRRTSLRAAVAALAALQASFVSDDHNDGWRLRLVQRRRLLQAQIAAIVTAWQAIEGEAGQTPAGERFRTALLQFRARVAEHQALWPAVSIDAADPRFIASRDAMRASSAEFHAAAAALPPDPQPTSDRNRPT